MSLPFKNGALVRRFAICKNFIPLLKPFGKIHSGD